MTAVCLREVQFIAVRSLKALLLPALLLCAPYPSLAEDEFSLAKLFSDNAVLQQAQPNIVWGTASPGAKVSVQYGDITAIESAGADGTWEVQLPSMAPTNGQDLKVAVDDQLRAVRHNVATGEVWLCSGQSNMEWPVRSSTDADREIAKPANDNIRLLKIERNASSSPISEPANSVHWQPSSPSSVPDFSAACFYFGRELQRRIGGVVGLISASWGGSIASAWTSMEGLRKVGSYEQAIDLVRLHSRNPELAEQAWKDFEEKWWERNDPEAAMSASRFLPDFDDKAWRTIALPRMWEDAGFSDLEYFDGVVWFRTTVELDKEQVSEKSALLKLGAIDDADSTWVNGVLVGSTDGWQTQRRYLVPGSILKPGINIIAIRVLDGANAGGFAANPEDFELILAGGQKYSLAKDWSFQPSKAITELEQIPEVPWSGAHGVTTLYNGMIAPLTPYTIRGVAWYQGESDRTRPEQYTRLLPNLIADWREKFSEPALPFLIVQLSSFGASVSSPQYSAFAEIREIQRRVAMSDGNSDLVPTMDIGDRFSIHPANKQEVGRRLALSAINLIYEPANKHCALQPTLKAADSQHLDLEFSEDCGLKIVEAGKPLGFQICTGSLDCQYVDSTLIGATIIRLSYDVDHLPSRVRYCWSDSPICNLYQSTNVPIAPFELFVSELPAVSSGTLQSYWFKSKNRQCGTSEGRDSHCAHN